MEQDELMTEWMVLGFGWVVNKWNKMGSNEGSGIWMWSSRLKVQLGCLNGSYGEGLMVGC